MTSLESAVAPSLTGEEMRALAAELFPICRSITGNGVRETLRRLQREIPLTMTEVPSGTAVLDWTVPDEWNIRGAWIKGPDGNSIVDFRNNNLHVVGYSVPVRAKMPLEELKQHLFSLPDQPDVIPYRTSYYKASWGFCLTHAQLQQLPDGEYEVCIDATLQPGSLTIGECFLPGTTEEEILISCHGCHPSLANDNLSGIVVATALAQKLLRLPRRYSYRFLFIPGTIGSITWLALNESRVDRIRHGLVLTCVGDRAAVTYKKSRRGDAPIDRVVQHVLRTSNEPGRVLDFFPYGYDERQYCSPGFNLPVGCFMRSQHGTFPEYHTSADNLDFIDARHLGDSCDKILRALQILERNRTCRNLRPKGEPRLSKYGLYRGVGGTRQGKFDEMALLWVLNLSDGTNDLLTIAERAGLKFEEIADAADALGAHGLLDTVSS